MDEQQKKRLNLWLELARLILAAITGLLGGGAAQTLL